LAITPIVLASGPKLIEDQLLNAGLVTRSFTNAYTSPAVIAPGMRVRVDMPVAMQSFEGYFEVRSFALVRSIATLSNGRSIPVEIEIPEMTGSSPSSKPDKTDVIPLMLNVVPEASVTVPSDPQLSGAVIEISSTGALRVMSEGRGLYDRTFDALTTFRVARDKELQ